MLAQGTAVLDRFGYMGRANPVGGSKVGNGARDFQHPVVGAGRPVQAQHGRLQDAFAGPIRAAMALDLGAREPAKIIVAHQRRASWAKRPANAVSWLCVLALIAQPLARLYKLL